MTRGRPPQKGLDVAIPIAKERGQVMEFQQTSENLCDFIIFGNGCCALVRVRKARRLHGTVADLLRDFSGAVLQARTMPNGGPVSREIWLYSRFCVMRYFRITDTSIVELDRRGQPLVTTPTDQLAAHTARPTGALLRTPPVAPVQGSMGGLT